MNSINVIIIGKDYSEKTVQSLKECDGFNILNASIIQHHSLIHNPLEKQADFLVICNGGDSFSKEFFLESLQTFQDNPLIGGIYTNYLYKKITFFQSSFDRQRIVRNVSIPPITSIYRKNLFSKQLFSTGKALELFFKFTDKNAMYHIAKPLYEKSFLYDEFLDEEEIGLIYGYSDSDSKGV